MNVVIYARYSCSNQTEQSIEGQIKECTEYAKRNKLTIVGEYIDRALSGTSDDRPQFLQMIEDSSKRNFKGVLVYKLDRFARNRIDSALYKDKLKKNGVRLFSAMENITDTPESIILESVLEGMNEYYSVELSQKVKRGMNINASKCLSNGGNIPLGYKTNADKKYEVDNSSAHIVKTIFDMYLNNYSANEIIDFLNSQNYKTSKGNSFNKNSINNILSNKKYIGIYTYNGTETKGGIPPIIQEDVFYKVQEKKESNKSNKARAKTDYLLSSKLFCGYCNNTIVGISGTSHTNKLYTYYRCNCNKKYIPSKIFEDLIIGKTRELLTDTNIEKIATAVVELANKENNTLNIKNLQKQLKKLQTQKQNLFDSLKMCELDDVKQDIFNEISKLNLEIKEIEHYIDIEKIKENKVTIPQVTFFLNAMRNGNINDIKYKKMLINTLVNKIYLYEDNVTIIFNTQEHQVDIKVPSINEIEGSYENVLVTHTGIEPMIQP